MSIEKIHKAIDEVLGTAYTNKALGDFAAPAEAPDKNDMSWLDEDTSVPVSSPVDKARDFITDVLMDFLYNNRDPVYVYTMLRDQNISGLTGLEISALIGEVDRIRDEKPQ